MKAIAYLIYKIKLKLKQVLSFDKNFYLKYLSNQQKQGIYPKVINIEKSLNELINSNKSLVRFGDGEFSLCFNKGLAFQKANKKLMLRLKEILKSSNDNCMVAIVDANVEMKTNYSIEYWSINFYPISTLLINADYKYYEANIFRHLNFEQYQLLKKLWKNKSVIFVIGKGSRFVFDQELFEGISNHIFVYGKAQNAWDEYDKLYKEVKNQAVKFNNQVLVLVSLGPTASVLCYDLANNGVRAIDIGHISNQYLRLLNKGIKPENMPLRQ